jgi:hypothetical protein
MSIVSDIINPYRIWFELGAFVAVVAFGTWLFFHIEGLGEAKEAKHVAAAVEAQHKIDQKDVTDARLTLAQLQAKLDAALAAPPAVHTVHVRVCDDPVRPDPAHENAGASPGVDEAIRPGGGLGDEGRQASDITDDTYDVLGRSKALIEYLQGYIRTCQDKGFCEKETANASPSS